MKIAQQLQRERDARVADMKETLAMIDRLMQFETGIVDKGGAIGKSQDPHPTLVERIRRPTPEQSRASKTCSYCCSLNL